MKATGDSSQILQRVKVGMTGLALVLVLIGLASVVFSSASNEAPVDVAGAAQPDVVANLSLTNGPEAVSAEPLAELGVAPSTTTPATRSLTNTPAPAAPPSAPPRR